MVEKKMVLTAVGPDRPGLVMRISSVIHEAGGNLEDSRMAVLAGDFALIVLFSGSEGAVERVQAKCHELEGELNFQMHFKPATPRQGEAHCSIFELEVTGVDRPGIVHQVSEVLAGMEANVVSLESRLTEAAFHGTPMFSLRAELQLPAGSDPDRLESQLDEVCADMNLTYDLGPAGEEGTS